MDSVVGPTISYGALFGHQIRSSKGVGGQRGLVRYQRSLFCPFGRRRTQFWGTISAILGPVDLQPPSCQPLIWDTANQPEEPARPNSKKLLRRLLPENRSAGPRVCAGGTARGLLGGCRETAVRRLPFLCEEQIERSPGTPPSNPRAVPPAQPPSNKNRAKTSNK